MAAFPSPLQRAHGAAAAGETVIGAAAELDGRLTAEHTVRVLGFVRGEVTSTATIVIEVHGRVSATVTAPQVIVAGQVEGQLHGTGRVELRPTARVRGEIHTRRLVIQEGATFEGRVNMGETAVGSAPAPTPVGVPGAGGVAPPGQESTPPEDSDSVRSAAPG